MQIYFFNSLKDTCFVDINPADGSYDEGWSDSFRAMAAKSDAKPFAFLVIPVQEKHITMLLPVDHLADWKAAAEKAGVILKKDEKTGPSADTKYCAQDGLIHEISQSINNAGLVWKVSKEF